MSHVMGVFRSRTGVAEAVRRLAERSVPSNEIDIVVLDADGRPRRRVSVEDESGTTRGAVAGAIIGAAIGVVVVLLLTFGAVGAVPAERIGAGTLFGALRAIAVLAAAGVPLGGLIGLGYWNGRTRIGAREAEEGAVAVIVETDELVDVARSALEESGADEIAVE